MKIYNVSLRVSITQIAEVPEASGEEDPVPVPAEKFTDDPMKQQERILNRYMDRLEKIQTSRGIVVPVGYSIPSEGAQMSRNVKIAAAGYDDLSNILKLFSEAAKNLHEVPAEVMKTAIPVAPDNFPSYG